MNWASLCHTWPYELNKDKHHFLFKVAVLSDFLSSATNKKSLSPMFDLKTISSNFERVYRKAFYTGTINMNNQKKQSVVMHLFKHKMTPCWLTMTKSKALSFVQNISLYLFNYHFRILLFCKYLIAYPYCFKIYKS